MHILFLSICSYIFCFCLYVTCNRELNKVELSWSAISHNPNVRWPTENDIILCLINVGEIVEYEKMIKQINNKT